MSDKKLKPCWHCGESVDLVLRERVLTTPPFENDHQKIAYVECLPCDAEGVRAWHSDTGAYGEDYDYIAAAVKMWNSRQIEGALQAELTTLREENAKLRVELLGLKKKTNQVLSVAEALTPSGEE